MQVRCVRAFGTSEPGDLAEVPDGAAADPEHWEMAPGDERQSAAGQAPAQAGADGGQSDPPTLAPPVPAVPAAPKEM